MINFKFLIWKELCVINESFFLNSKQNIDCIDVLNYTIVKVLFGSYSIISLESR